MFKTQITRRPILLVVLINLCAGSVFVCGCHRGYYRRQADIEAQRLIHEKASDPRWNAIDGNIDVDPQSRMFNPFSQDHPPIPPDDPKSHQFMHEVDGKEGYPHWHANGDTPYVESPEWRSYLPVNAQNQVVVDLETAFRLAKIHSTDLQEQRETLYLSALDVSIERFGFDSQLFSGFNSFFSTQGRLAPGGSSSTISNSLGANGEGIRLRKLGITGANFAAGLANSIIWNFAGANTQSASALIDFSIIQPLLRGAGRERIMESLTQAERQLLANVRQMDRFRRGFYLEITTGRNAGTGPSRFGNFLGAPQGASSAVGGFLGLIQLQQQIRIQEFNVKQQQNVLEQFREFYLRDRIDALQVRQFENSVYNAQRRLLASQNRFQDQLDQFKQSLGLPPDLDLVIEDPFLDRFEFISDAITKRQNDLYDLRDETGTKIIELGSLLPRTVEGVKEDEFEFPTDLDRRVSDLMPFLNKASTLIDEALTDDRREVEQDLSRLKAARPDRVNYLRKLRGQIASGKVRSNIEPAILKSDSVTDANELTPMLQLNLKKLEEYKKDLEAFKDEVSEFAKNRTNMNDVQTYETIDRLEEDIPELLTKFSNTLLEMSLLQVQARANSVEISDVDLDSRDAVSIARCFRRDWMNARAGLVDQWRQIEFVADQLEAQVDLVFEGEIGNTGDNPFKIRTETGQLRAGFRFDAPIVRMSERNQYRQTLIEYQQSRRDFYQFEDEIKRNLRQTLRAIDLNKILFEINRKSVQVAIEQVELARLSLDRPPAQTGGGRSTLGATTARDLTQALDQLQNAQNDFLDVWVTYEVLRRSLDFDLGTMQVTPNGRWIDPGQIDGNIGQRAAQMMGISMDNCSFCADASQLFATETFDTMNGEIMESREAEQALSYDEPPRQIPEPKDPVDDIKPLEDVERPQFEGPGPDIDAPEPGRLEAPASGSPRTGRRLTRPRFSGPLDTRRNTTRRAR